MAYGLEKVTKPKYPIYRQLENYYKYCSQVCAFSPQTMSAKTGYINYFVRFSGITRLEDITNDQIFDWIDHQKNRGNCGRSINHRLAQLKVMLRWQRDDNVVMPNLSISRIPMQKEVPARKNFFTRKQINFALLFAEPKEKLMIKLAFDCGLRIGELVKIKISDINGCKIKIIGKGGKLRWVMMNKTIAKEVEGWIKRENIKNYLWPSPWHEKEHITTEDTRRAMQEVFHKAGFDNFVPHDLRHSFATELKLLGVSTRKIMLAMGHSSEAITERYLSDLDGVTIESIKKELKVQLFKLRVKTFFSVIRYAIPRVELKHSH